ncbi:MAG: hypothetical protein SH856_04350 [Flavobacteriales bacterium]|nr:hypothetical protein [Flavobacteriales bacterium]
MKLMVSIFMFCIINLFATAQSDDRIKLFLNCENCNSEYVKTEITWVDYMRDLKDADVILLVTTISTGSGGQEYQFAFTGQNRFAGVDDVLKYSVSSIATEDEERKGIVHTIKLGLMRYAARLSMAQQFEITNTTVAGDEGTGTNPVEDLWKAWVFSVGVSGDVNGEKISQSGRMSGSFSANKVTEKRKIGLSGRSSYSEQRYSYSGTTDTYIQRSTFFNANYIHSLGGKLSAGVFANAGNSDYSNSDLYTEGSVGIEYDFFPYSEAQTRVFAFTYTVGTKYYDFHEITIYNKLTQYVHSQNASLSFSLTKPWGSISFALNGSTFLDDISKHRYGGFTNFDVRIFKGLSVNAFFVYDVIHDQIGLPAGGASEEEILLSQQELATSYSYFSYFGLNYRFGSIYNNVVNPRFESGSYSFSF